MQCNVALQECCTLLFTSFHCVLFSLPNVHESTRSSIHLSPDRAIPYQNQRNLQLQNFSADTSKDGFKTIRTQFKEHFVSKMLLVGDVFLFKQNLALRARGSHQSSISYKTIHICSTYNFMQARWI